VHFFSCAIGGPQGELKESGLSRCGLSESVSVDRTGQTNGTDCEDKSNVSPRRRTETETCEVDGLPSPHDEIQIRVNAIQASNKVHNRIPSYQSIL